MKTLTCQCCGLPFSPKMRGTNHDQSRSSDYCFECYQNGKFTDLHITIQDMEKKLLDMARHHDEMSIEEAHQVIAKLPDLKRWKMTHIL